MKKAVFICLVVSNSLVLAETTKDNSFDFPVGYGITASPAIKISTRHDDNIFLRDHDFVKSSWITELAPSLKLEAREGTDYYSAQYTIKAGRYHSSRDDDYVDHLLEFDTHTEFNHRNKLDLAFDYLRLHETRGSGISDGTSTVNRTPDEFRDSFLKGQYTYGGDEAKGRIKVEASYLDKDYTNHRDRTRVFDREEDAIGGTFYYRIMPKTSLLFETKYKDISYDNKPLSAAKLDSDEALYQVGVTWEATAKTTGTAQVGKTYKDFDSSRRKDRNFTSWELGVEYSPLTYSVFDISAQRYPTETKGTGSFVEVKEFAVSWQHAWSEKLSSAVQTSFINEDYIDSIRNDDLEYYGISADYQFRYGVGFGISYNYSSRDSNISNSDYHDRIFMLSVKLGM